MMNDTIDIVDAKIVNIGINFTIVSQVEADRFTVLRVVEEVLKQQFLDIKEVSEPISVSDIYRIIIRCFRWHYSII